MNRLNRYALSLLALSVTLAIIAGVNATPTQASGSAPVTVLNTPLPVRTAAPSLVTHLGQNPRNLVLLVNGAGTGELQRFLPDGTYDSSFTIPSDQALVITDVEWQAVDIPNNTSDFALYYPIAHAPASLISSTAKADSNGQVGGAEHLTTGIVVTDISKCRFVPSNANVTVQGYLVPNP